jgi:hypothetical protein
MRVMLICGNSPTAQPSRAMSPDSAGVVRKDPDEAKAVTAIDSSGKNATAVWIGGTAAPSYYVDMEVTDLGTNPVIPAVAVVVTAIRAYRAVEGTPKTSLLFQTRLVMPARNR